MKRRKGERRIDGWSFRYFSRQSSSPEGKKNALSFIAPAFSLGVPRLKPRVMKLVYAEACC
jgi:hypothetical protein